MTLLPKDDLPPPENRQADRHGKIHKYRKQFLSKAVARRARMAE